MNLHFLDNANVYTLSFVPKGEPPPPNKKVIKVQTPLVTNDPNPKALMYSLRGNPFEVEISYKLRELMGGKPKKFAWGCINPEAKTVVLIEEAPWQDW